MALNSIWAYGRGGATISEWPQCQTHSNSSSFRGSQEFTDNEGFGPQKAREATMEHQQLLLFLLVIPMGVGRCQRLRFLWGPKFLQQGALWWVLEGPLQLVLTERNLQLQGRREKVRSQIQEQLPSIVSSPSTPIPSVAKGNHFTLRSFHSDWIILQLCGLRVLPTVMA